MEEHEIDDSRDLRRRVGALLWELTQNIESLEGWKVEFQRLLRIPSSPEAMPPVIAGDLVRQAGEKMEEAKRLLKEYSQNLVSSDITQGPENREEIKRFLEGTDDEK